MEKIYISKKWFVRVIVMEILLLIGLWWYQAGPSEEAKEGSWGDSWEEVWQEEPSKGDEKQGGEKETESGGEESDKELLGVHVTGAVCFPDQVYYLEAGSRVGQAIEAAGGALEEADLSQLNLADYLRDGERIYVPVKGEEIKLTENSQGEIGETPLTNINLASKIELLTLPGIGEAYAQRILDYREKNGPFESIEDIMKVKGIGESKFAELKDRITVG